MAGSLWAAVAAAAAAAVGEAWARDGGEALRASAFYGAGAFPVGMLCSERCVFIESRQACERARLLDNVK